MLRDWEREHPGRIDRIFGAMGDIVPSHLMDRNLYPFATLQPTGAADADGDRAFDDDEFRAGRRPRSTPTRSRRARAAAGRELRHGKTACTTSCSRPPRCSRAAPSLNSLDTDVSSYSHWPAERKPVDLRLRAAAVAAGQSAAGADARGRGAARRSRRPASSPRPRARRPTSRVQLGARITAYRPLAVRRPVLVRPGGSVLPAVRLRPLRPAVLGSVLGPRLGLRLGLRRLGTYDSSPYYEREVAILIRDRQPASRSTRRAPRSDGTTLGRRERCCRRCSAPRCRTSRAAGRPIRAGSRSTMTPALEPRSPAAADSAPPASARSSSS